MKLITLLMLLVSSVANAGDYSYYAKIGTGYKIIEPSKATVTREGVQRRTNWDYGSPITARIEIGLEKENISFGLAHHSQWLDGWPFNKEAEYHKTEIFIDYKFTFGGS